MVIPRFKVVDTEQQNQKFIKEYKELPEKKNNRKRIMNKVRIYNRNHLIQKSHKKSQIDKVIVSSSIASNNFRNEIEKIINKMKF